MASTYSTNLKIELMATGENSGTWGGITNTNLGTALEQAVVGYGNPDFATDANLTISLTDSNAAQVARALVLNVTSTGSLSTTRELIVPTIQKQYIVQNNTSGGQSITVKTSGGSGITVPNGRKAHLYVDGTNVIQMFDFVDINGGAIDGTTVGAASASTGAFTTLTASDAVTFSATTQNIALGTSQTSSTFTVGGASQTGTQTFDQSTKTHTLNIGAGATESAATKTINIGTGGVATSTTAIAIGSTNGTTITLNGTVNATTVNVTTLDLTNLEVTNIKAKDGTAAATIADSTGAITVSTQLNVDNLRLDGNTLSSTDSNGNVVVAPNGTGDVQLDADTVRVGDSNANATITTNGTGDLILNTNSGTNSGSITIEDGVNGNIIIAPNGTGQVQISNAALDLTTIEVTNIKAKDGTASITLADSTGVASFAANPVLSGGTANGVLFLNGSKVATSGSALTFNGTRFSTYVTSDTNTNIARFGVQNTANTDDAFLDISADAANNLITLNSTGNNTGALAFQTGNTEQMRLTTTGLGIGTSSPSGFLANKLVIATGGTSNEGITIYSSSNNGSLWFADATTGNGRYAGGIDYQHSTNELIFYSNSSGGMRLDASGNLGLGVTPSASGAGYKTFQLFDLTSAGIAGSGYATNLTANAYLDAGTWTRGGNTYAPAKYSQFNGAHVWSTAAAAGTTITWTDAMTLDASGNLLLGETAQAYLSRFTLSYDPVSLNGPIFLDNRSYGINRGGSVFLGGKYNTAGNYRPFGGIYGRKENATDGNSAGYLAFYTNGNAADATERARITSVGGLETRPAATGHAVFNEDGVDADFRVESDTNTHALFVDAGNSQVAVTRSSTIKNLTIGVASAGNGIQIANSLNLYPAASTGYSDVTGTFYDFLNGGDTDGGTAIVRFYSINANANERTAGIQLLGSPSGGTNVAREMAAFYPTEVVMNDASADQDFRVESDNNTHMLFVNAGTNRVSVGGDPGTHIFNVLSSTTGSPAGAMFINAALNGSGEGLFIDASTRTTGDNTVNVFRITNRAGADVVNVTVAGEVTINEGGSDVDFRVESDTNTHMLFVDAGNNGVNIGNNLGAPPLSGLRVAGATNTAGGIVSVNQIMGYVSSNYSGTRYWVLHVMDIGGTKQQTAFNCMGDVHASSYTTWNLSNLYIRREYDTYNVYGAITGVIKNSVTVSIVDISYSGNRYVAIKFDGGDPGIEVNLIGYLMNQQYTNNGADAFFINGTAGVTENAVIASY